MLDFSSTAMGFNSFSSKPQPILDDPKVLALFKKFQYMFDKYNKLEVTNDPTYLRDTKNLLSLYSEFKKFLEERMTPSYESSLGPLHAYGPSSSKSPHHSSYSKSYHDSPIHYLHSSSSMSSSSTRPLSSSSS